MKIKIWQAFASNNSGSYTIVGSFDTPELATEVAAALRTMAGQHTAWLENARGTEFTEGVSPLGAFAQEHGLSWVSGRGTWDEWPEHDDSNIPAVIALGHQVLVHVGYTVSMPPTIGEFFYRRGGRVTTELDHAHAPIVSTFVAWWPWEKRDQATVNRAVECVIEELTRTEGLFARLASDDPSPGWRSADTSFEGDLLIVCVFDDLCAGCRDVGQLIERHGGRYTIAIAELSGVTTPFAGLTRVWPRP